MQPNDAANGLQKDNRRQIAESGLGKGGEAVLRRHNPLTGWDRSKIAGRRLLLLLLFRGAASGAVALAAGRRRRAPTVELLALVMDCCTNKGNGKTVPAGIAAPQSCVRIFVLLIAMVVALGGGGDAASGTTDQPTAGAVAVKHSVVAALLPAAARRLVNGRIQICNGLDGTERKTRRRLMLGRRRVRMLVVG